MGEAFRESVYAFASTHEIPVIRFKAGSRKLEEFTPYFEAATSPGVVAIGVAQELQRVTMGSDVRRNQQRRPQLRLRKVDRRVTVFYFYILDSDWGPCVHQDLHLLSLPDQGVVQRTRVGEAPAG